MTVTNAVQHLRWDDVGPKLPNVAWLCDFIGIPPDSKITVGSHDTNPPSYYLLISTTDGEKKFGPGQFLVWDDDRDLYVCNSAEEMWALIPEDD